MLHNWQDRTSLETTEKMKKIKVSIIAEKKGRGYGVAVMNELCDRLKGVLNWHGFEVKEIKIGEENEN